MQTQAKNHKTRSFGLAFAGLALLATVVLFSSPVRTFAEGIIQQIGGYAFQQGTEFTSSSRQPGPVSIVRNHADNALSLSVAPFTPSAASAAEASKMAGFLISAPAYLPGGFSSMGDWYLVHQDNGDLVTTAYKNAANHFFTLNQLKMKPNTPSQTYTKEQIVDVTVGGRPGIWLPSTANDVGRKDVLVWEANGITNNLTTDFVPLDELIKVAESLGK